MTIFRSLIAGAILATCLAVPAGAQRRAPDVPKQADEKEKDRARDAVAIDKQYKETLERTKKDAAAAPPPDPWANLRTSDDSKTKR
jgi:hypothetical protein